MFLVFYPVNLYICVFMTCSHRIVFMTHLWSHGIYVCVYVQAYWPLWFIMVWSGSGWRWPEGM